jgi:hypothetical protein
MVSARLRELFGQDAELIQYLAEAGWWFDPISARLGGELGAWRNGRGDHARDAQDALALELAWLRPRVARGEAFGAVLSLPLEPDPQNPAESA